MPNQHFDGMDVHTEDVLLALCYRFTIVQGAENWMYDVISAAYDDYHDAKSTKEDEKKEWIEKAIAVYEEEGELPTFAMQIGASWIKNSNEHEFIAVFREKHFGRMEGKTSSKESGRVLRREVQKNGGGAELPVSAVRSAK